jgi:hypothetical protein
MFTFKNGKNVLQFVMWNNFPSFLTCFSYFCCPFTPGKQPYFEIIEMTTHREPARTVTHARDHWWTLDFANAFVSPAFPGNMVDFRRRCIKLMRARELFPANFAFRWLAYYWMGCWSLQHCDSLVFWKHLGFFSWSSRLSNSSTT